MHAAIFRDVIFLAEAFTRPAVMQRLAKEGFSQSYTYFTWRNTKHELTMYFTELTATDDAEYLRPNLFANTPDILHAYLQRGGRPAFETRLLLAATLGATYGIYSGFELCENAAVGRAREEYADSEKYQIRKRRWDAPGNINELVMPREPDPPRAPGAAERTVAAVSRDRQRSDHRVQQSRQDPTRILSIINLDPHHMQHGHVDAPADADIYTVTRSAGRRALHVAAAAGTTCGFDPGSAPGSHPAD